jgi:hypothetical protein
MGQCPGCRAAVDVALKPKLKEGDSMKRTSQILAVSALILGLSVGGSAQQEKEPVDYVNPNIGGIGQLLTATSPIVKLPAGMASVAPITTPGITDHYLADKIYGFPAGGFTFMPLVGPPETDAAKNASLYDHDLETATPYYYQTTLEDSNIVVEYSVSAHGMYYRIAFPEGAKAHLLLGVPEGGEINLAGPTSLSGRGGAGARGGRYFYAEFSKPVASSNQVANLRTPHDRRQAEGAGLWRTSPPPKASRSGCGLEFRRSASSRRA